MDFFLDYGRGYDYSDPASVTFLKYLQAVSQIGVFILPALAYAWLYNRKPLAYLELNKRIRVYPLFISILAIVVAVPAVNFLVTWNEQMSLPGFMDGIERWMREMESRAVEMTDAFLRVNTVSGLLGNLFIIGLLAALGEELLFRGVILKMLSESLRSIHIAVILSALLFSAFHGQFYGFVPRMVLGMLFGYIFIWTRSLWVPIVLHFLFNSVSVVVAFLFEKGVMDTNYEEFGESSAPWMIGLSVVFTMALLGVLRQKFRQQQERPMDGDV
jgi:membrane protease YdiL (CAAX protease family)